MSPVHSTKQSARRIFTKALGLSDSTARAAYLNEACGSDLDLRRRLERMLAAQLGESSSPLDAVEAAFGPEQTVAPTAMADAREVPQQLGPYKLLEEIGEGGFGTVYMAEQTVPVRRRVALKITKPGMDSREVIARFEAERQALAMMDHPNVARILDGGTTPEGRPYFAMELVRGIPITEYCDEVRLTNDERLKLFIDLCRAIQHAHQKGIIHRDLKPSNVMVTMHDDKAVIKVIDFGIAKALSQPLTDRTLFTGYQQLLGTPLYMSPEQAQMSGIDIDTRSDVYSLGVMLYELLTGTTPFTKESLANVGFDELRRIIRELEPPRPSARITTLDARARSTIADHRRIDQRRITDHLRGELDWIVMKALEKDRNRRYESASALAADVESYLNNEPVIACPPTFRYRLKKYLLRHRAGVSWWLAAVAVVLICGVLIAYPRYHESRRMAAVRQQVELALRAAVTAIEAGDLALAEKSIANAMLLVEQDRGSLSDVATRVEELSAELGQRVSDQARFEELLTGARDAQDRMTYGAHLKGDETAHETLNASFGVLERDDWLQDLDSSSLTPEQKSRAKQTVYETLLCLADYGPRWIRTEESARKSLELLKRAEQIRPPTKVLHWVRSQCHRILNQTEAQEAARAEYDATPATTALDHYLPGHTAGWNGNRKAAIEAYQAALRIQPDHYNSLFFLADRTYKVKRVDEAIAYYAGCIALRPDHVFAWLNRAEAYEKSGDLGAAEMDLIAAAEADTLPGDRVYAFRLLLEFYNRTSQRDKHAAALARLKATADSLIAEQTAPKGSRDGDKPARLMTRVGNLLCEGGDSEGISLLEQGLAAHRLSGAPDADLLIALNDLGRHLGRVNRRDEGIALLEEALAVSRQLHGAAHRNTLIIMRNVGTAYVKAGQAERGIPLLEESLLKFEQSDAIEAEDRLHAMARLGYAYNEAGISNKAIPLLEDALTLAQRVKKWGPDHDEIITLTNNLGYAYLFSGQPERAVPVLQESLQKQLRVLGENADQTRRCMSNLGMALLEAGQSEQAVAVLARALEINRRNLGAEHEDALTVLHNLASAHMRAGQFVEGVELFEGRLKTLTRLRGAAHPDSMNASGALLEAYRQAGKGDEQKQLALARLQIARNQPDNIQLSSALASVAEVLVAREDFSNAEPPARECLEVRQASLPGSWLFFNAQSLLGGALLGLEKYEEAEPLLLQAIDGLDERLEEIPEPGRRHIAATLTRLVKLYESTGQPAEAARWNARLQEFAQTQPLTE